MKRLNYLSMPEMGALATGVNEIDPSFYEKTRGVHPNAGPGVSLGEEQPSNEYPTGTDPKPFKLGG